MIEHDRRPAGGDPDDAILLPTLRAQLVAAAGRTGEVPRRRWPRSVLSSAAAVVLVTVAATALVVLRDGGTPAAAHVAVERDGDHWIVTVEGARATPASIEAALAQHGVVAQVHTEPVGPSRVGQFLGTAGEVPLVGGDGFSAASVRVPVRDSLISLRVGRLARPGEAYVATSDAFGPGEPLECSGIWGQPVDVARPELSRHFATLRWIAPSGPDVERPPGDALVVGVLVTAPGEADVVTNTVPASPLVNPVARGSEACPVP